MIGRMQECLVGIGSVLKPSSPCLTDAKVRRVAALLLGAVGALVLLRSSSIDYSSMKAVTASASAFANPSGIAAAASFSPLGVAVGVTCIALAVLLGK